jgi:hypothetical protein
LADLSFTNLIRRRPRADPVQKHVPGDRTTQKGIDSSRPVTEARISAAISGSFSRLRNPHVASLMQATKHEGGETPTDAYPTVPHHTGCGRALIAARSPVGVPPRHLRQRTNAAAQLQNALPGTRLSAGVIRRPLSQSSDQVADRSSCRPGVFPKPPGSGGDEPPPAGTALAPASRRHRLPSCS